MLVLGPQAPDARSFVTAAATLGLDLKVVAQASAALLALYAAPLALIRPDQIVAWRGSNGSDALRVLAQASGHPPGAL